VCFRTVPAPEIGKCGFRHTSRVNQAIPTIATLRGLWRRSLLARPDGSCDTTTSVRWLQGPRTYVDLRQPPGAPDFSAAGGSAHLSMEHCAWLARQAGFAGHLTSAAGFFEWRRSIDFQPAAAFPDAGTLWWQSDMLVEKGRDVAYIEHWHRDGSAPTLPFGALTLREAGSRLGAILLRVGMVFMFARERAADLPAGATLAECVAGVQSLREAQALVDCEISFGEVHAAGFQITTSTLPYRTADMLGQTLADHSIQTTDRDSEGTLLKRRWEITEVEGEVQSLECEA
jgi:hypothetical protein